MHYDSIAAAVTGSAVTAFLAKALIHRSMRELEEAVAKIMLIREELARISVKLESFEKAHDLITKVDRRVVALESKFVNKTKLNGGSYETEM